MDMNAGRPERVKAGGSADTLTNRSDPWKHIFMFKSPLGQAAWRMCIVSRCQRVTNTVDQLVERAGVFSS
jgi:hypothetical protein